ncbi:hypothetical protein [Phytomonospora endophytica]|uniref:Transcriptional regulator n=1 Tax=Phytomonospora endophytica TaxID=714109 RepID=A0A841FXW3_9ACTN|nr:hypothetical protein [Phytomonospora endophytica]MBB6038197.1 hypothetical protein [Phytomonospora endophytica]
MITTFDVIARIVDGLEIPPELCGLAGRAIGSEVRGAAFPVPTRAQVTSSPESLTSLRIVLDAYDCPADGATRSLGALSTDVSAVVRLRLDSRYEQLGRVLPGLLPELTRAMMAQTGQRRAEAAKLLVQAYRAADAIADKLGLFDLSARIIGLMTWAAAESGDPLAVATAAYVRGEMFFASGDYATGRRVMERAADQLLPEASRGSAAAYGALHMRAAVLAGRGGDAVRAMAHVNEALDVAGGLSEGIYRGTVFGPASVQIHRLTLAVELQDVETALAIAGTWTPPETLPAERRSHFFADAARAFALGDAVPRALEALQQARLTAPEQIRTNTEVLELVGSLVRGRRSMPLTEFAQWLGQVPGQRRSGSSVSEEIT